MHACFTPFSPRFSALTAAATLCAALISAPAWGADPGQVAQLLHVERLFAILGRESEDYASDLGAEFLGNGADPGWHDEVRRIHDPARLQSAFEAVLADELKDDPLPEITRFLSSETGQRMIDLELDAREALLDPRVEAAAEGALEAAEAAQDARLGLVRDVIAAAGLVEENVAGGLNTNFAFSVALAESGVYAYPVSKDEILAELIAEEPALRDEVTLWLESYLMMAYAPASEAELRDWLEFTRSDAGQALLHAQFAGFDRVFNASSAALGHALARRMMASSL
ncbi:DUF2059 domain-containing protein [Pseudothioclava arenosa]|uniref:DUF2059 domain-containing protein n=1 Tax=Pseudothioclava arenosa TaxID=1795308 RepID=A0A2A4CRS4_9RHOB|nr:DUF2059 domain-containing protein [Pseudothioclava arenosa]PCD76952.1 hypothetical protein CLN94_07650 [Pseudothioclava arenosa]